MAKKSKKQTVVKVPEVSSSAAPTISPPVFNFPTSNTPPIPAVTEVEVKPPKAPKVKAEKKAKAKKEPKPNKETRKAMKEAQANAKSGSKKAKNPEALSQAQDATATKNKERLAAEKKEASFKKLRDGVIKSTTFRLKRAKNVSALNDVLRSFPYELPEKLRVQLEYGYTS